MGPMASAFGRLGAREPTLFLASLLLLCGLSSVLACGESEAPDDRFGGGPQRRIDEQADAGRSSSSGALPTPSEAGALQLVQITAGDDYTCVLWNDGQVQCWGANEAGQLGLGDVAHRGNAAGSMGANLPAVQLGGAAQRIRAGGDHACAVLVDGSVKCWGENFYGSIGQPHDDDVGHTLESMGEGLPPVDLGRSAAVRDLGLGSFSSCALLVDGRVKCWGDSFNGELGYGDDRARGGAEGGTPGLPLGDALPPVDIGFSGAVEIRMGFSSFFQHSCAFNELGQMKCWGGNNLGQLGLGDTENRGDDANEMGGQLPMVPVGERVVAMALGDGATCVIVDTGQIRCWGFNVNGQLGLGDTAARGTTPGNLPLVHVGASARAIDIAMFTHTCAIFDDRTMKCWGRNQFGQLGLPDTSNNRGDEPGELGADLPALDLGNDTPLQVATGEAHTCVRFASQRVKCWGKNEKGELGYGDTKPRGAEPGTMGEALPYVDLGR